MRIVIERAKLTSPPIASSPTNNTAGVNGIFHDLVYPAQQEDKTEYAAAEDLSALPSLKSLQKAHANSSNGLATLADTASNTAANSAPVPATVKAKAVAKGKSSTVAENGDIESGSTSGDASSSSSFKALPASPNVNHASIPAVNHASIPDNDVSMYLLGGPPPSDIPTLIEDPTPPTQYQIQPQQQLHLMKENGIPAPVALDISNGQGAPLEYIPESKCN